jgi:hypothetical protein
MSIKNLQTELNRLTQEGQSTVSIEALQAYLTQIEGQDRRPDDLLIADFNAKHQSAVEEYKEGRAEWRELFKAVISNGQATIRLLATINGGGSLALLAFIGKVWSDSFSQSHMGQNVTYALLFLCIGLGISAFTQGLAYVGQHFFTYGNEKVGNALQVVTGLFGILSLVSFFTGVLMACKGFGLLP